MKPDRILNIAGRRVGEGEPTYFVADIAANHDGDLSRAIELVHLAADCGADAAKFQHFQAESIVSDFGFKALGSQLSHQATWKKSVYDTYKDASLDLGWTPALAEACRAANITFFTSPYSIELVDAVDPFVPAYKIGSGDITWIEIIRYIAAKGKPVILASGASSMEDVCRAVDAAVAMNPQFSLMQCNTNYTASLENFRHIQLNVLRTFRAMYPEVVLGLSDHTPGHATVLGAVTLGARVVEKHFTDDVRRTGPDHAFSMDPRSWREMVERTRELEYALGGGVKRVEDNEAQTAVLQRRAVRYARDLPSGWELRREDLLVLRPAPANCIPPHQVEEVVGHRLRGAHVAGEHARWIDLE